MGTKKRIIIAGAGEVGKYLAEMLSKESHDITVIDTNSERLAAIGSQYDLMTIQGSGSSFKTLEEAKIKGIDNSLK